MRVHLRWWANGQPQAPVAFPDEAAARAAVQGKYPQAHFSGWQSTAHSPSAFTVAGVDEQMFAWADRQAHAGNADPVADLLRARS